MQVPAFVTDLAKRAGHTFWQTFLAALGVLWASSGLHVADLVHVSALHKLAVGVVAAAAASALSALKSLMLGVRSSGPAGDVPAIEPDPAPAPVATPAPAVTPADPAQPAAGVPPPAAATA